MLIRDILARNVRLCPNRPAVQGDDEEVTHGELSRNALGCAAALRALGIGKGDRIAALSRHSPRYVELFFAAAQTGAVLVPLNHLFVAREIREILADCGPKALLFAEEYRGKSRELRESLPPGARALSLDGGTPEDPGLPVLASRAGSLPLSAVPLEDDDPAMLVYTLGPDGRTRGAVLSNGNLAFAAATGASVLGLSQDDVYLSCHPFPFIAGPGQTLMFLSVGGTTAILSGFDPERVLRTIDRRGVTHLFLTSTMMARILDGPLPSRPAPPSLKTIIYGGTAIPLDLIKRAIRAFGCAMVRVHGPIEASGILTFLQPGDHSLDAGKPHARKLLSAGRGAPGIDVRIVDETGTEVPRGTVGDLVARGPNVFRGYHGAPRATGEAVRDGWLHTGEAATMDDEGYVFVMDRRTDVLSIGGLSVSPREIEEILLSHRSVGDAAVIGRSDYEWGEVPVAVVVPKDGGDGDRDAILEHCRTNLAPFKVPRDIEFIGSLPRNSQGKVLKVKLKERNAPSPRRPRP